MYYFGFSFKFTIYNFLFLQGQIKPSCHQQVTLPSLSVKTSDEKLDMLTKKNEDMVEDVARLKTMLQKQTNNLIAANREKEALKKSKENLLNDSKILKLEAEERSRDLNATRIEIGHLKECKKGLLQELQRFKTTGERSFVSADVRINTKESSGQGQVNILCRDCCRLAQSVEHSTCI